MKEPKLGRSFSDLLAENHLDISSDESIQELDVSLIKPNPNQPRTSFDNESLQELADSIKEHGIIQPIIVKPAGSDYILVAGERRLRAAKMIGLQNVPSIVREYNALYLAELAILENLQREDLSAVEEALALQKLQYHLGITHEELGKKIGKSRTYVTNALGLLNLPAQIIDDLTKGVLSAGHARALSKLKDHKLIIELRNKVVENELTVRDLETLIRNLHNNKEEALISKSILSSAQKRVNTLFDLKFKVKVSPKSISLNFKTEEELQEILKYLEKIGR